MKQFFNELQINDFLYVSLILKILHFLFHKKVISREPLQKKCPKLVRTRKNKFYEIKIKLNYLNLLKTLLRYD